MTSLIQKLLFTDLDDSLFQSHRKSTPQTGSQVLAYNSDGVAVSYGHPHQLAFLQMMLAQMTVIPVTARNTAMFRRVAIQFPAEAILNYGGLILNSDGKADEDWLHRSHQFARQSEEQLKLWQQWLLSADAPQLIAGHDFDYWAAFKDANALKKDLDCVMIVDHDLIFYAAIKSKSRNNQLISAVYRACCHAREQQILPDMTLHQHGHVVAIMPRWLDKSVAVEALIQRYQQAGRGTEETESAEPKQLLTIGMGDSLIDLQFIKKCQYHLIPNNSQIATLLNLSQDL